MRRVALFALLGTALAGVQPAHADGKAMAKPELRKVVRDYARCVVRKHPDPASEVIIGNYSNEIITKRFTSLIDRDCIDSPADVGVSVDFFADSFRYSLADALTNLRFAAEGPADFADRLPLTHLKIPDRTATDAELAKTKYKWQRDKIEDAYKSALSAAWLSRYGECIVRQLPEKSRLWLLTTPDGPEEMSRIDDLAPAFAPCLPASAGTLRFSRFTMRGTVAINYYRLAMATPIPGKQH